jgi:hypothetical protein
MAIKGEETKEVPTPQTLYAGSYLNSIEGSQSDAIPPFNLALIHQLIRHLDDMLL